MGIDICIVNVCRKIATFSQTFLIHDAFNLPQTSLPKYEKGPRGKTNEKQREKQKSIGHTFSNGPRKTDAFAFGRRFTCVVG